MVSAISFTGNVTKRGKRKTIEISKSIREFIPIGQYQVIISALGTVTAPDYKQTE